MVRALFIGITLIVIFSDRVAAEERTEHFDKDPGWEGKNNRAATPDKRTVRQDFGYSRTANAGGKAGEIGGYISPAAETAYYAKKLDAKSFDDVLTASGKLLCRGKDFHVLVGFFNSDTANEWRMANSIAIRLLSRGEKFFAFVEYATSSWRAGGDSPGGFATFKDPKTNKAALRGFQTGKVFDWTLRYDPKANAGTGAVTVTIGDET